MKIHSAYPVVMIVLTVGLLVFTYTNFYNQNTSSKEVQDTTIIEEKELNSSEYLISEFPQNIPLYELQEISSSKFLVNDDISSPTGELVNYYNVVFKTTALRNELFEFYKSTFDTLNELESSENSLSGTIGEYKVVVSQYADTDDTVYLQVFLPSQNAQKENKFFVDYPNSITQNESWIEKESSYGLLNQKGGEIEYTQYFILDSKKLNQNVTEDPFKYFYNEYEKTYSTKNNFKAIEEKKMLTWNDGEYQVTMSFSSDHKRIYVMIRKPM